MSATPILELTEIEVAQASPSVPLNANYRLLEAVIQLSVISALGTPPGSPSEGDRYIVASGSGAWSGHDGHVAFYANGGWLFAVPLAGWLAYNVALAGHYRFSSGSPSGWIHVF